MPSNAAKGSYYKRRTWKWLEAQGYALAHLERTLPAIGTRKFPVKVDQLGSDLLAVSTTRVLFVQVKHFAAGHNWAGKKMLEAKAEFAKYPCPPNSEQWIVVWPFRAHEPIVVRVSPLTAEVNSATRGDVQWAANGVDSRR